MNHLEDQISALIDGELTGAELDRASAHLAACERCRAEAAAERQLKRALRALAAGPFEVGAGPAAEAVETAETAAAAEAAGGAPGEGGVRADEALTRRLLAMAGPGGPVPSRGFRREQFRRKRGERRGARPPGARAAGGSRPGTRVGGRSRADVRPRDVYALQMPRRRSRYVVWSAVSLVVVGIGAAAFSMGGGTAEPGPKITPQLNLFSVEHAITSGDVPLPDPSQASTARP